VYQFVSAVLLVGLLVLGGFFGVERCNHNNLRKQHNNSLAELEGVLQETETAKSIRALFIADLEASSEELQDIIDDRDQEILAQTEVSLRLKSKLLKADNVFETVVIENQDFLEFLDKCEGYETLRHKVEFEIEERPVKVTGFTLTNPPEAEVTLEWVEDLKLELNLAKDDDGNFRVYTDSEDFQVGDIVLKVDPEVLEMKWYERISFGADLAAGEFGAQLGLRPGYDVLDELNVNLLFVLQYDGGSAKTFYGGGVSWYPWK